MKKSSLLSKLVIMLALVPACFAGTTSVTGTIQDPNGQVFANGTVTATFVPNPDAASAAYTVSGLSFAQSVTGTLNGSGAFTIVLTDNLTVSPALSKWNITVCPQASVQCSQYIGTITGASLSLTTQINAVTPVIAVQPNLNSFVFAYTDGEIVGPRIGTTYYNTTSGLARIYNGTTWASLGGASSAWASGGVTAGVLCKSNGAGLCLDSSTTDNGTNVVATLNYQFPLGAVATPAIASSSDTASGWYWRGINNHQIIYTNNNNNDFAIGSAARNMILSSDYLIQWSNTTNALSGINTTIRSRSANNITFGIVDTNGVPGAQNLSVQNAITGANLPGSNFTIFGSNGTGSGGGGSIIFQTGVPHGADSVADTFTTALTIDKNQLVTANVSLASPQVNATAGFVLNGSTTQTQIQGTTGTKLLSCTGSFTSGNIVKTDANGNCVDGGAAPSGGITELFSWCDGVVGPANGANYALGPAVQSTGQAPCNILTANTGIPMTRSVTVSNMYATSAAVGAVAGSGVIKVYKNNVATTVTCTLGTGSSCNDTTHSVAFVAGDKWSVVLTTGQLNDTTSDVRVQFQMQ